MGRHLQAHKLAYPLSLHLKQKKGNRTLKIRQLTLLYVRLGPLEGQGNQTSSFKLKK